MCGKTANTFSMRGCWLHVESTSVCWRGRSWKSVLPEDPAPHGLERRASRRELQVHDDALESWGAGLTFR